MKNNSQYNHSESQMRQGAYSYLQWRYAPAQICSPPAWTRLQGSWPLLPGFHQCSVPEVGEEGERGQRMYPLGALSASGWLCVPSQGSPTPFSHPADPGVETALLPALYQCTVPCGSPGYK